jgi:DNA-binding transcriptional LysR family regulator
MERLIFIAAPDHPLAKLHEFRTEMLADHTLLLSSVDCNYRRILEQMLYDLKCESKMILEFNSVAAIVSNVIGGLGVTLIPEVVASNDVRSKKMVVLPWTERELEVAQLMIWHHEKWLTPVLKGFMEVTREVLKIR